MKVFGIAGWKNSGKTTLVSRLVRLLSDQGVRVSTIKQAHHPFDVDHRGKDSYRHREAGAREVLISSTQRWVLLHEGHGEGEPPLEELLAKLAPVDLVLVEGFKHGAHPKLALIGPDPAAPLPPETENVVAYASAEPAAEPGGGPAFARDDVAGIAAFILEKAATLGMTPDARGIAASRPRDAQGSPRTPTPPRGRCA